MRQLMGFRTTLLILIILISGCATTPLETITSSPPATVEVDAGRGPETTSHHPALHASDTEPDPAMEYTDLWERIRDGFAFPSLSNKYVDHYKRWYANQPKYLERLIARAQPYLFYIVEEVEKRDLPTELVLLPAIESAFKPTAYSRAHAVGLWQFIPSTARRYHLKMNWWYDGRRDVVDATRAALDYLEFLHKEFNGDWFHALAAYNAGEGQIQHAIKKNQIRGRVTHYTNLRLRSETRRYVPKLIAFKEMISRPDDFGIKLTAIPNQPYFTTVNTGGQIDLNIVRELSGISTKELHHLNAGFKRWATDPDGPHRILIPTPKAPVLAQALSSLPQSARLKWGHYTIRHGETLSQRAKKYGVSVQALQQSNHLKGTFIRAGNDLLIPLSSAAISSSIPRQVASNQNPVVHRVRSGDTLWGIARRYNVYVNQLTKWNSIRTHDLLRLGQNIVIYMN